MNTPTKAALSQHLLPTTQQLHASSGVTHVGLQGVVRCTAA